MITINRDSWHWNLYTKWLVFNYRSTSIKEVSICGYIGGLIGVFIILPIISCIEYVENKCPKSKIVDQVDEHDPTQ